MYRVEITFSDGSTACFSEVIEDTLKIKKNILSFTHGANGIYRNMINMDSVFFIRYLDEMIAIQEEAERLTQIPENISLQEVTTENENENEAIVED